MFIMLKLNLTLAACKSLKSRRCRRKEGKSRQVSQNGKKNRHHKAKPKEMRRPHQRCPSAPKPKQAPQHKGQAQSQEDIIVHGFDHPAM